MWTPFVTSFVLTNNVITFGTLAAPAQQPIGTYIKVQLKADAVANNYGGYEYTKLNDIINNFMVAYVGQDKY